MKSYDLKLTVTARVNLSQEDLDTVVKEANRGDLTKAAIAALNSAGIPYIGAENVDQWLPVIYGTSVRRDLKELLARESEMNRIQVSGGFTPRGSKGGSDE